MADSDGPVGTNSIAVTSHGTESLANWHSYRCQASTSSPIQVAQSDNLNLNSHMTARSKLGEQKKEAASSFCPFAPVVSFLVAKVCKVTVAGTSYMTTACPRQGSNPGLLRLESLIVP